MTSSILMPLLVTTALIATESAAFAQQPYPGKPIRFISPYAPGGSSSTVARLIGQKLTENWGQHVLVDNRPGGNTIIGTEAMVKATPDGHTILLVTNTHVINSLLIATPYDANRDFAPVATLNSSEYVLVVHPSVPANNVREFMSLVRAKPGTFSFASSGNGSPPHMAGEMFNAMAGVDMVHVPYKGNGPAYNDLIGGQVPVMFPNITTALQYVRSGKLRALAVTSRERTRLAPEIPTMSESGLPGFELNSWFGLLAPAGTPQAIVNRLQNDIAKFYQQPELRDKLMAQGVEPLVNTPAEFGQQIQYEIAYWAKMFKTIKLKPE